MADIGEVVAKLLQRTKEGKVKWSPTVREDMFLAAVGNQTMTIAQQGGVDVLNNVYVLRVFNSNGFEVAKEEQIPTAPRFKMYDELAQLWGIARNAALNPEHELNELLQALNAR